MEAITLYLIKFSLSLVLLFLFYRLVLRPLTFYQWNRFYLLGYSLLSFALPFIDITPWINEHPINTSPLINSIPPMTGYALASEFSPAAWGLGEWIILVAAIGSGIMILRLISQYLSLRRIRARAVLLYSDPNFHLYETSSSAGPFSFGNAIYINPQQHREDELQRIIRHEIVHVKQRHTIDLLTGELLCVINWYNPFAWLIRHAIRQNLEFIADDNVLREGYDRKEYQYLLLKVLGVPHFSIVNHFNLPNLKKRIAMMNKIKSTRLQLAKFGFVLPLLVIALLAFRSSIQKNNQESRFAASLSPIGDDPVSTNFVIQKDTVVPPVPEVNGQNSRGYIVTIADNQGECIVLVRDPNKKILKAITLDEWNQNKEANEARYGKIPPPPTKPSPIPEPPVAPHPSVSPRPVAPQPPAAPNPPKAPRRAESLRPEASAEPSPVPEPAIDAEPAARPNPSPSANGSALILSSESGVYIHGPSQGPLYIVDGDEQQRSFDVHSIDPTDIESVSVWKDQQAVEKYGDKGSKGVIDLQTKLPLYIIDGEVQPVSSDVKKKIKPENIESMNVLKGERATEKYGTKGRNGAIEIRTRRLGTSGLLKPADSFYFLFRDEC